MIPVIDFHCDLLSYLAGASGRTPNDSAVRCSFDQMQRGGVKTQICALFSDSVPGSAQLGLRQLEIFRSLKCQTKLLPAIENASVLIEEGESLDLLFERLKLVPDLVYLSLTWNSENRFGGPAGSAVGIKEDGIALLERLSGSGIAVDVSHASDLLAEDVFNIIDEKGLDLSVIASHSNCRAVADYSRNLPDHLIKKIAKRGGVIGINFVRHFARDFEKQLNHFRSLGVENSLVLGADFFYDDDENITLRKPDDGWYFEEFGSSACYPNWLERYGVGAAIAHENAERFLNG